MDKETFNRQYKRAVAAGGRAREAAPRARAVSYDRATKRLIIELRNGVTFIVPGALIQGLAGAQPDQIAAVKLMPRGAALHWDELDVQMSVPGMVAGIFGTKAWMAEIGRKGGSVTSEAKRAAARENGSKGGRPAKAAARKH